MLAIFSFPIVHSQGNITGYVSSESNAVEFSKVSIYPIKKKCFNRFKGEV